MWRSGHGLFLAFFRKHRDSRLCNVNWRAGGRRRPGRRRILFRTCRATSADREGHANTAYPERRTASRLHDCVQISQRAGEANASDRSWVYLYPPFHRLYGCGCPRGIPCESEP